MKVLRSVQKLPVGINVAWEFFSNPAKLKDITPPYMGFDITSDFSNERMYQGMIITYKVSPLLNIPVNWVTEITQLRAPYFFVDNQKSGPFKYWHHQHIFREVEGGTEMTDIVNYAVPYGLPGRIVERMIVRQRVEEIFRFRHQKLESLFGKSDVVK